MSALGCCQHCNRDHSRWYAHGIEDVNGRLLSTWEDSTYDGHCPACDEAARIAAWCAAEAAAASRNAAGGTGEQFYEGVEDAMRRTADFAQGGM